MGSEMCIRDRWCPNLPPQRGQHPDQQEGHLQPGHQEQDRDGHRPTELRHHRRVPHREEGAGRGGEEADGEQGEADAGYLPSPAVVTALVTIITRSIPIRVVLKKFGKVNF